MIDKWNEFLDYSEDAKTKFMKDYKIKSYFNNMMYSPPVSPAIKFLENDEYTKGIYSFIKNSNYNKTCRFEFQGKNRELTYQNRVTLTRYPCFFVAMYSLLKRSGGYMKIFSAYILLSALICRENFDLRTYKLQSKK